eukprot:14463425-Ditylum_brightwellii.AAC.1
MAGASEYADPMSKMSVDHYVVLLLLSESSSLSESSLVHGARTLEKSQMTWLHHRVLIEKRSWWLVAVGC